MTDQSPTAQKILNAAKKLFAESGYSGASTRKIADSAGVNEVTLFRLFKNKHNLLVCVYKHFYIEPNLKIIQSLEDENLEVILTKVGQLIHKFLTENINIIKIDLLNFNSQNDRPPPIHNLPIQITETLTKIIAVKKEIPLVQAEIELLCFVSAIRGLFIRFSILGALNKHSFDKYIECLVSKFK